MTIAGSNRPARPREPAPPLVALFDMPLRGKLEPAHARPIEALAGEVRALGPEDDWREPYARAVELAEAVVAATDEKLAALEREALEVEDPNELRQRLALKPRKDAEKLRDEARATFAGVAREWSERSKRQASHVVGQCLKAAEKSARLEQQSVGETLRITMDDSWWAEWSGWVSQTTLGWTEQLTSGVENALEEARHAKAGALLSLAGGEPLPAVPAAPPPVAELRLDAEDLPHSEAEVPTVGAALMRYLRTNLMAVGMMGTILVALVAAFEGSGVGASSGIRGWGRGAIYAGALIPLIFLGLRAARQQRVKMIAKAEAEHRRSLMSQVKDQLTKVLERHRLLLERWAAMRVEAHTTAIDAWWSVHVEPDLERRGEQAAEAAREIRLEQSRKSQDLSALRSFRAQLAQTLLFDLRRKLREWEEINQASGEG